MACKSAIIGELNFSRAAAASAPLGVSKRHACPVGCQPLGNRGTNAARTASDYRDLARQLFSIVIVHVFCSFFYFVVFVGKGFTLFLQS